MQTASLNLNEGEHLIRKTWLIANLARFSIAVLFFLILFSFGYFPEKVPDAVVSVVFGSIYLWLVYHFIYKKSGTFLLSTFLVCFPISVFFDILGFFHARNDPMIGVKILFTGIFWIPDLVIYPLSHKLKKIHKKIQFQAASADGYAEAMEKLSSATSHDELQTTYGQLVRNWPRFASTLKDAFKKRQKELASPPSP